MSVDYPRPVYSSTAPTRPRVEIPPTISTLSSKSLSAPASHLDPGKLLVTPSSTFTAASTTDISPCTMPEPTVHPIYNPSSSSWTYIVGDPVTEQAVIIDPVLEYNPVTNVISTKSADKLLDLILMEGYTITFILETRLHRTHISASRYLQHRLQDLLGNRPRICAGAAIGDSNASKRLSKTLVSNQGQGQGRSGSDEVKGGEGIEGYYFDHLCKDYEQFRIGNIVGDVVKLPFKGAEENVGYLVGINVFTSISMESRCRDDDGWRRLLNLPSMAKVYGGTERGTREESKAYMEFEEMKAIYDRMGAEVDDILPKTTMTVEENGEQKKIKFYATEINIRGGRIPAKINLMLGAARGEKRQGEMPEPLKIPKKLQRLLY